MMAKEYSALTDPENDPVFVDVTPPIEQGMSVEDAYRHLADMPAEPVEVEEQV